MALINKLKQMIFRCTFVAALVAATPAVSLANPANGLRIDVMKAYNLIVDSNVLSPSSYSPRSAFLGARVFNDGATVLSNVTVYIGNFTNRTPGIYPTRTYFGQTMSLTHEGGAAGTRDAVRFIDRIQPGQSVQLYWLISYPLKTTNNIPTWGTSVKPDDDLFLFYDIWADATRGTTNFSANQRQRVFMRNEITASANKIYPNTANKVPVEYKRALEIYAPQWTNTVLTGQPGEIIRAEGFWYDLGNIGAGFDNDGDLVPDSNAWLQPVGDPAKFDPSCFRLVRTYAFIIVKLKTGGELVLTGENKLYFDKIPPNTGGVGFVGYEYMVMRESCASLMVPYQEVASGFDNEKYNADFGATPGGNIFSSTSSLTIAKTVDKGRAAAGEVLTYTVSFTNQGDDAIGAPENNLPLAVHETIPAGTRYIAGSASVSNILPAGVTKYTILYSTNTGTSFSQTEPAAATNVTDIQWWMSHPMPTGTSGRVRFQVTMNNPFTNDPPRVINTAGLAIDGGAMFKTNSAITIILGSNSLSGTVFIDTAAGTNFANGVLNSGETGISNILLTLYYDLNDDGLLDANDVLFGSTNSSSASVTNYVFNQLPDGNYIVTVDRLDGDLPFGFTITSNSFRTAALDPFSTNATGVSTGGLDFGFAPVLALTKTGSTNVFESGLTNSGIATYTITLTNRFAGTGDPRGTNVSLEVYAGGTNFFFTTALGGAQFFTPGLNITGAPNNAFATAGPGNNVIAVAEPGRYSTPSNSFNITNIFIVIPFTNGTGRATDRFIWKIYSSTNTASVVYSNSSALNLLGASGVINTSVWSAFSNNWNWSRFNPINSNMYVVLEYRTASGGGSGANAFAVDTAYFLLQTDGFAGGTPTNQSINPLPLYDYYDTNLFDYVNSTATVTLADSQGPTDRSRGRLFWSNLGPLHPGGSTSVTVQLRARQPFNNTNATMTNIALVTNAFFIGGVQANSASSTVQTVVRPTGTIGDFVWRDLDRDGVQDGGAETGIAGVSVRLSATNVNLGNGPGAPITNVTDSSGFYLFTGLPSNAIYTVTVLTNTLPGGVGTNTFDRDSGTTAPNNLASTNLTITATNGTDTTLLMDFGYNGLRTQISGTLWEDINCGSETNPQTGEPFLTNVTVQLVTGSTVIATTTTTTLGFYSFSSNFVGTSFVVRVLFNTGTMTNIVWTPSFDSDGVGAGSTNQVSLNVASNSGAVADFGYCRAPIYTIGDTIFYDLDGNGSQSASEEGITNVTVRLYLDANSNGVYDIASDPLAGTRTTSTNGFYLFTQVVSNRYIVIVDLSSPGLPPGYTITADPQGALDGVASLSISNASDLTEDFGFQPVRTGVIGDTVWRDLNYNGIQDSVTETGISNVTVTLRADLNGDGIFVTLTNLLTDASGKYCFTNLSAGNYCVVVSLTDTNLPADNFGILWRNTTPATNCFTLAANSTNLTADFGFASYGAIGDTIYFDHNENAQQDFTEDGIFNVTVFLYIDVDGNGILGTNDVLAQTDTTDSNGNYLFTALTATNYLVIVSTNGALTGFRLSGDPTSVLPCSDSGAIGCDSLYSIDLLNGQAFMGADFGYVSPDAVLGDTLWIDFDNDGKLDTGESGIPYITVWLYSGASLVSTTETDADGIYLFSGLGNGNYYVVVNTNDIDWPSGLMQSYDPDGVFNSIGTNIVISNDVVVSIGGTACSECDLNVDFGYRFASTNKLYGTIGLDDPDNIDGVIGTNSFTVSSNEVPFSGITVYAYLWNDDGDGIIQVGETRLVNTTTTRTNGNYSFTDLPNGSGTNSYYLISIAPPVETLSLTTTLSSDTPATYLTNYTNLQGRTTGASQAVPVAPLTLNVDFAFISVFDYDYGDAPNSYDTALPYGARHVSSTNATLYLGASVDLEDNGFPGAAATGDDLNNTDDENGVINTSRWQHGTSGGSLQVTVGGGSGYLVGYIDFDQSANFAGSGNLVVSQSVSSVGGPATNGVYTIAFNIPDNTISTTTSTYFYSRFRLMPSAPLFPTFAYNGDADSGEVEDYRFAFHVINGSVYNDVNNNTNINTGVDTPQPGVIIDLYDANTNLIGSTVTSTGGGYSFNGLIDGNYFVRMRTPTNGASIFDADGGTNSFTNIAVTVSSNSVYERDFLLGTGVVSACLNGFVYDDNGFGVAGNGLFGTNDAPVQSVVVSLYRDINNNTNGSVNELVGTLVTDITGYYNFTNLPSGKYLLSVTAPGTATNVTDTDGITNGRGLIEVTMAGTCVTNQSFLVDGVAFALAIGDRVWFDFNGNGIQDSSETRIISNVTVQLVTTSNFVVAQTTTGTNGLYQFTNVPAGTYYLRFDLSSITTTGNVQITAALATANTNVDSDVQFGNIGGLVYTEPYNFPSGSSNMSIDLGIAYITIKTRASIVDVTGEWRNNAGHVVWETGSEWGTAGFYVFRVDPETGKEILLNEVMVPSAFETRGAVYEVVDPAAKREATATYRIEEIEVFGDRVDLGTHTVTFATPKVTRAALKARALKSAQVVSTLNVDLDGPSDCLKVSYRDRGIYAVTLTSIADGMGKTLSDIQDAAVGGNLQLSSGNQQLAYHHDAANDRIIFYGEGTRNFYARDNSVTIRIAPGALISRRDPGATGGRSALPVRERYETDKFLFDTLATPVNDLFYWEYIVSGNADHGIKHFSIDMTGYAGGDVNVKARLIGMTHTAVKPDHQAQISFNGQNVKDVLFNGQSINEVEFVVPAAIVSNGLNTVSVRGLKLNGSGSSFVLDWIEASYERSLAPSAAAQHFLATEVSAISASAYANPVVLSINDGVNPVLVADSSGELTGKSWMTAHHNEKFALSESAAIPALVPKAAVCDAWFTQSGLEVDYLVVVSRAFTNEVQALVDYRAAQGLRVGVAVFEDICDIFRDGLRTPEAVHDLIAYAAANWSQAPWLVVLAGNGHYDFLNAFSPEVNPIPPLLHFTDRGIAAADGMFTDLNGDNLADIAVGRLPALTGVQLTAMINKIIANEAEHDAPWQKNMSLVADQRDGVGTFGSAADFGMDSDEFAAKGAGSLSVNKIYRDETTLALARTNLINQFNQGAGIIQYTGHGNFQTMGKNGAILGTNDVASLSNLRHPLVIALSCMVGRFEAPGLDSLGELLMRRPNGGAVAVWSPSGMSEHDKAREIGRAFYRTLLDDGAATLGIAIINTIEALANDPAALENMITYNLLGDPAMKVAGLKGSIRHGHGFSKWRWQIFNPDELTDQRISGSSAVDPVSGLANFGVYALGGEPGKGMDPAAEGLLKLEADGAMVFEFKRRRAAADIDYRLRISEDLHVWEDSPADVTELSAEPDADGVMEKVRTKVNRPDAPHLFIGRKFIEK